MKIGIITMHNSSNYGGVLQAYALQAKLSANHDVKIINFNNKIISNGLKNIRFGLSPLYIYFTLTDILNYKTNKKKNERFKKFINQSMYLTKEYSRKSIYDKNIESFDMYISGSDQIWNPKITNKEGKVDPIYFCDFAPENSFVASYASSFGNYDFANVSDQENIKKLLTKYAFISVRERESVNKLKQLLNIDSECVIDPVLLLSKEEWIKNLSIQTKNDVPYLLVYALRDSDELLSIAFKIAEKKQLNVKVIGRKNNKYKGNNKIEFFDNLGPIEFVEMFINSHYCITNSFHGTAFSINFNIPFIALENQKNNGRITNILKETSLESRLCSISDLNSMNLDELSKMNFNKPNERLELLRNQSFEYIDKAIGSANK